MKLTNAAIVMTILSANGWAAKIPAGNAPLTICFGGSEDVALENRAEATASDLFSKIGVQLRWRSLYKCPDKTIRIELSKNTPAGERPTALAYALPYEGTHIVVFFDRVRNTVGPGTLPYLLGHVIAHEIAHILQGEVRHSASGVMKTAWDAEDFRQMAWKPLSFTDADVRQIKRGWQLRSAAPDR